MEKVGVLDIQRSLFYLRRRKFTLTELDRPRSLLLAEMPNLIFSIAKFYPFLKLCNYLCENFADGFVARIQVKLSLTLLIAGVFGFVFECLNAFEYLQGIRPPRTDFIY